MLPTRLAIQEAGRSLQRRETRRCRTLSQAAPASSVSQSQEPPPPPPPLPGGAVTVSCVEPVALASVAETAVMVTVAGVGTLVGAE
jgi:hypothetical protein